MSSGTSTKPASRALADGATWAEPQTEDGLRPWQFFVLAGLGCATAVTWMSRGRGPTAVILLSVLMGAVALVGLAALRMVRPLVSPEDDRTAMIGERTRAALEREKMLTLRAIKELEFDRAMKKLSDEDFREMSGRLRARAARLIRQLDAGAGYREQIEQDLAKRLGDHVQPAAPVVAAGTPAASPAASGASAALPRPAVGARLCAACSTGNDQDARFCKACGAPLA